MSTTTAETITPDVLRSMISSRWPMHIRHAASCALYADVTPGERRREAGRCADARNARCVCGHAWDHHTEYKATTGSDDGCTDCACAAWNARHGGQS